jgi:DnaK suppressor protein
MASKAKPATQTVRATNKKPAAAKKAPVAKKRAAPAKRAVAAEKPVPAKKGAAVKEAATIAAKPAAKAAKKSPAPKPAPVAAKPVSPARPAPAPVRPVVARPSSAPKDVAAAHEYLLARSAGRSGESVIVNGRRLPTEEQLLKMSDRDYMNADQLAFFKHRLHEIARELTSNAEETTEHLRETVVVPDPADRATIEEEHALELRTRDRERKLLRKVQDALQLIETGEYGYCEETGDPIGIPRLLARPTATLSLEAQQRRELKQKLFGD